MTHSTLAHTSAKAVFAKAQVFANQSTKAHAMNAVKSRARNFSLSLSLSLLAF